MKKQIREAELKRAIIAGMCLVLVLGIGTMSQDAPQEGINLEIENLGVQVEVGNIVIDYKTIADAGTGFLEKVSSVVRIWSNRGGVPEAPSLNEEASASFTIKGSAGGSRFAEESRAIFFNKCSHIDPSFPLSIELEVTATGGSSNKEPLRTIINRMVSFPADLCSE